MSVRITILQPPYPHAETIAAARECQAWVLDRLAALHPEDADLIVLPEYVNVPGLEAQEIVRQYAETDGAAFIERVIARGAELRSAITLSMATRSQGDTWVNRAVLYDTAGTQVTSYDKIHLTDAEVDPMGLSPGTEVVTFNWQSCTVGFAICFDLYFPEYFATLSGLDVDLIICPTYQRSESAERICHQCQVRAVDTGAYLLRSTYAIGTEDTGGRSLIAAPDGRLLGVAAGDPEVLSVTVDPQQKFNHQASYGKPMTEHRSLIESHRCPDMYRPNSPASRAGDPPL